MITLIVFVQKIGKTKYIAISKLDKRDKYTRKIKEFFFNYSSLITQVFRYNFKLLNKMTLEG